VAERIEDKSPLENQILDLKGLTTKELVIYAITELWNLKKAHSNHLAHHFVITLAALTAGFAGIATFIVGLLLLLVKK